MSSSASATSQETVTVSGASPVVDVSSTVTQTNISKDLYENIPTGRNPWTMAGLVPGVVTGRLDVGGTEGAQQYNIEAFGSANSQKSFSIDGLKVNWAGGDGGATMMYYGFEMYDEYNMQTASGTAESDVSGVFMNMVTKSGGNRFSSDNNFYFMNDALQGSNIDDDLRVRLGLQPGQETGAAGNPIDISYDWSSTLGGPIARDKAWFFGAIRWWRLDQFQIGASNPGRLAGHRRQPDPQLHGQGHVAGHADHPHVVSLQQEHQRSLPSPRRALPDRRGQGDRAAEPAGAELRRCSTTTWSAGEWCWTRASAACGASSRCATRRRCSRRDIAIRDVVRNTRINAAETQSLNPNGRYQGNFVASYFLDSKGAGTHDLKGGLQLSWERVEYERIRNGDILLELQDGRAFQAQLSNTPINSDHRLSTWGFVRAGSLAAGARDHQRRPPRRRGERLPAGADQPGRHLRRGPQLSGRPTSSTSGRTWRRGSASRTTCSGNGRTALKAYYGRFYNQFGSQISEAANPNALVNQAVSWSDTNGNLAVDPGELGLFTGFPRGLFPTVDGGATRPYSQEYNVGFEQQLAGNMAIGVSYHRREHRNGLGILDHARGFDAYTPIDRTYVDPISGQTQAITIYNLKPEYITARDRYISNVEFLESNYDGAQFDFQKRMSNRWQMLAGLSLQQHRGFDHSGTYTGVDFSNPNSSINRYDSSVFIDLPWTATVSGTYQLPWDIMFSGKYTARAGDPLNRTATFTGLTASQASETVRLAARGTDRTEDVTKFIDLRFAKRFRMGSASVEPNIDLFNLLNANHVLLQNEQIGSTWGRPTRILTPRIIRFGVTARF